MVSTVTTTTVSTVTTAGLAASLGLILVITLVSLLIQKEAVTAASTPFAKALNRVLNAAVVPLLLVFATLVMFKIVEFLQ